MNHNRDCPDRRSPRNLYRDAAQGNERMRWRQFCDEFLRQHSMATMAEARAAFDREEARG